MAEKHFACETTNLYSEWTETLRRESGPHPSEQERTDSEEEEEEEEEEESREAEAETEGREGVRNEGRKRKDVLCVQEGEG